jgi:hypothetical protein
VARQSRSGRRAVGHQASQADARASPAETVTSTTQPSGLCAAVRSALVPSPPAIPAAPRGRPWPNATAASQLLQLGTPLGRSARRCPPWAPSWPLRPFCARRQCSTKLPAAPSPRRPRDRTPGGWRVRDCRRGLSPCCQRVRHRGGDVTSSVTCRTRALGCLRRHGSVPMATTASVRAVLGMTATCPELPDGPLDGLARDWDVVNLTIRRGTSGQTVGSLTTPCERGSTAPVNVRLSA